MSAKTSYLLPIFLLLGFLTDIKAIGNSPYRTSIPILGIEPTPMPNPVFKGERPDAFQVFRGLKKLSKQLRTAASDGQKTAGNQSDGEWLSISGLGLGVLVIVSWLVSPFLGILTTIPLGLLGLLLSIFGLKKARKRWYRTKAIRAVAIAGIALNGLLLILFLGLLAWSSS